MRVCVCGFVTRWVGVRQCERECECEEVVCGVRGRWVGGGGVEECLGFSPFVQLHEALSGRPRNVSTLGSFLQSNATKVDLLDVW